MKIETIRSEFPHTKKMIYLEHAAVSPLPKQSVQAMQEFLRKRHFPPVKFDEENIENLAILRRKLAQLIQSESDQQIALVQNTSTGLNIFAQGFPFQPGDHILIPSIEFPSNVYPYLNLQKKEVILDFLPVSGREISIKEIEDHFTSRTRVLAFSFVQFTNGFRADLKGLADVCHAHGALLVVDGIQGVGALQMKVRDWGVDFLSVGGHKWMLSPMGTGFMYISPRLLEQLSPVFASWLSVKNPWDLLNFKLDFLDSAQRFEMATTNFLGFRGMLASVELFLEVGPQAIEERVLQLSAFLIEQLHELGAKILSPTEKEKRSGIVTFSLLPDDLPLHQALLKKQIYLSYRLKNLRAAPHFYNTEEELKTVVCELKSLVN